MIGRPVAANCRQPGTRRSLLQTGTGLLVFASAFLILSPGSALAQMPPPPPIPPRLADVRQITTGFNSDRYIVPCFSPTGNNIVFNGRHDKDKRDALYVIRPDGTELEQVYAGDSPVFYPSWAPDASAICFNAGTSVYEYDVNTGRTRRIITGTYNYGATPAYTRDSRRIIYRADDGLRVFDRTTLVSAKLTRQASDRQPAPNPNGREVAFMSNDEAGVPRINLTWLDSAGRKLITPHKGAFSHPSWSPDGALLLYDRTVAGKCNLYVVDRRTGNETRLTREDSALAEFGSFSPDGKTIVFVKETAAGQNLYIAGYEPGSVMMPSESSTSPRPKVETVKKETLVTVKRDSLAGPDTVPFPDSTRRATPVDRNEYKIVIFASDDLQAQQFLVRLKGKGYGNPENYVTGDPTPEPALKYNNAAGAVLDEITELVATYLNLKLELKSESQIPEYNIYINLP